MIVLGPLLVCSSNHAFKVYKLRQVLCVAAVCVHLIVGVGVNFGAVI